MALHLTSTPLLLQPVLALTGWTLFMETWMYATRIPAIQKYGIANEPTQAKKDLSEKLPPKVRYVAENFNHLHEQPPYYAVVLVTLAVIGDKNKYTRYAAWSYVGVRIAHSLFQSLVAEPIAARFGLFATSSVILAGLTARAAKLAF